MMSDSMLLDVQGVIDSHCHLLHDRFDTSEHARTPDEEGWRRRAKQAGVALLLDVATVKAEWAASLALSGTEMPDGCPVRTIAGIHPGHAHEETVTMDELRALAANPLVVALGETGLDYYYHKEPEVQARQREVFRLHLEVAREMGLPVVIHTREAEEDTLAILKDYPAVNFVLHCFTASQSMAEVAVAMGGYVSFSGVLTFKKSYALREIAALLPRDRVLVETDSPYLAPEPVRGRPCEPAYVIHTARVLAACWSQSVEETVRQTRENTLKLFSRITTNPII